MCRSDPSSTDNNAFRRRHQIGLQGPCTSHTSLIEIIFIYFSVQKKNKNKVMKGGQEAIRFFMYIIFHLSCLSIPFFSCGVS